MVLMEEVQKKKDNSNIAGTEFSKGKLEWLPVEHRTRLHNMHSALYNSTDITIWAALNEVSRADEGEMTREWSSAGMLGRGGNGRVIPGHGHKVKVKITQIQYDGWGPRWLHERLACSPPTEANRVQSPAIRVTPEFSHVGIVPDNAASRRIFSGISHFPALLFRLYSVNNPLLRGMWRREMAGGEGGVRGRTWVTLDVRRLITLWRQCVSACGSANSACRHRSSRASSLQSAPPRGRLLTAKKAYVHVRCIDNRSFSTPVDLCFTAFGVRPLVFVRGSMNAEAYCNIQDNEMLPTLWRFYGMDPCYFQDDNARGHVSRADMQWYADNNVRRLDRPAQSPDLNPIEHL
ncbi:hypothetical protein PR048_031628 [Dryococelus australis]|uniref:Transposase n=1 Tax=Dryococelus australis TaxID=614101 RepID=A0ABQ9G8R8_9NEOP|nr:hypothetical protein PR048_031628 [Dryococelus australis]